MRIAELTTTAEHHAAAALLDGIWQIESGHSMLDASVMRALAYVGGYVAGAYLDEDLAGVAVGFFAADGHLHSHVTGVAARHRGRNIGYSLKRHQREWALARGITRISWTFDPLVRRNAHFNLHKLGAEATAYLPDFYGPMRDSINAGDTGDRLFVTWTLSPEKEQAAEPAVERARPLLDRDGDAPGAAGTPDGDGPLRVAIPQDVEKLRTVSPDLALRWRFAVRAALTAAADAGYAITAASRDGWYLLEKA